MKSKIYDFVFKGIMTSHCIRDLQASGILRLPAVTPDERREQDLFAPVPERIRTGSIHMQRYYRILYVLENFVRDFIITRFSELDGEGWFDNRATSDMKKKVEMRRQDEQKNQWHIGRNRHSIYYLDFGDLGLLINNHWAEFKDFIDNQAWVSARIDEAERTRNVIAHTNLLSSEEGVRLEMYLKDWLLQVG